jgi:hypothetical protein
VTVTETKPHDSEKPKEPGKKPSLFRRIFHIDPDPPKKKH